MLTVSVLSCGRPDALQATLNSFRRHIERVEPDFPLILVCLDNGETAETSAFLESHYPDVQITLTRNIGQGPGMNLIMHYVETPYLLHLEDDWALENDGAVPFLNHAVSLMEAEPTIDQLKLAKPADHTDYAWNDPMLYEVGGRAPCGYIIYHQNQALEMSGFNFPPSVTRVSTLVSIGPFSNEHAFQHGHAEYDYAQRSRRLGFLSARVRELTVFRHQDGPSCDGWAP